MKVFVTGSGGFVGRFLTAALREKGIPFVEYDLQQGKDITNAEALAEGMKGCDAVVHLAALIEEAPEAELRKINIEGTRNVLEAAKKNRVKKFILMSSVSVHGAFSGVIDEQTPLNCGKGSYGESKCRAEEIGEKYRDYFDFIVLRPPFILGPNNYFKKMAELIAQGFPLTGKHTIQFAYVRNLADAIIFLLEKGKGSGVFVVSQADPMPANAFYETVRAFYGKKGRVGKAPYFFAKLLIYYNSFRAKFLGKNVVFELTAIDRLTRERKYSSQKIQATGWKQKYSSREAVLHSLKELSAGN